MNIWNGGRKWMTLCAVLFVCIVLARGIGHANLAEESDPAWSSPQHMALRKISNTTGSQSEPSYLSNLDCRNLTYRTVADKTMRSGCFTDTAYGLHDTSTGMAIFNGTDEALQFLPYGNNQILVPWPDSLVMLALDTADTGGSYMRLHKNALNLTSQRDYLGRLISKKLATPADFTIKDEQGIALKINPQALTFSSNGSWMVAETMNGAFMRINLASLKITYFAKAFSFSGSYATYRSQVAISDDGNYVAINNDTAASFKVYDLSNCPAASIPKSTICSSYDYRGFVASQAGPIKYLRHLRFVNEGILSFDLTPTVTENTGKYLLAPRQKIESLMDYLALGDSYTSGEGAFNYRAGTDTETNHCHTSGNSYPYLITRSLFSNNSGNSVACSGATIKDLGSSGVNYRGQISGGETFKELRDNQPSLLASVETNFMPGYISQHRFASKNLPKIITVSVGGNDVGFGNIVRSCVAPKLSVNTSDNTCFNTYEDRQEIIDQINRTGSKIEAFLKQLAQKSPLSRIYAIGYPDIVSDEGSCAFNVRLDQTERMFTRELVGHINNMIAQSATKAGVEYIDISDALKGHRLCEGKNTAVNGLTSGSDAGIFGVGLLGKESYHPNALGHRLIEQEILKKSVNLTSQTKVEAPPIDTNAFLDKPRSGRPVTIRTPAKLIEQSLIAAGESVRINIDGSSLGFKSNTSYSIRLGGSGRELAIILSGIDGSLSGSFTIPLDAETGLTDIEVSGQTTTEKPITAAQPIYIIQSPDDYDGDGSENSSDSCVFVPSSGTDKDNDLVDDMCDNIIEDPVEPTSLEPEKTPAPTETTPPGQDNTLHPQPSQTTDNSLSRQIVGVSTAPTIKSTGSHRKLAVIQSDPTNITGAGARVLGISTLLNKPIPNKPQIPATSTPANRGVLKEGLPTINLLKWATIFIICWWIIVLLIWMVESALKIQREQRIRLAKF